MRICDPSKGLVFELQLTNEVSRVGAYENAQMLYQLRIQTPGGLYSVLKTPLAQNSTTEYLC